jgi:BTB/POZ domain
LCCGENWRVATNHPGKIPGKRPEGLLQHSPGWNIRDSAQQLGQQVRDVSVPSPVQVSSTDNPFSFQVSYSKMAFQWNCKLIIESQPPHYRGCITWKIHHFSCFGPPQGSLRTCQFSTNSGQVWQLELSTLMNRISCYCTLLSDSTSATNVSCTVSILNYSNNTNCYATSSQHKAVQGQKCELWQKNKIDIIEFFKRNDSKEEDVLTFNLMIELWSEDSVEVYNSSNIRDLKPQPNLNSSVTKLLTNNSLTDVTLKVQGKELKAHKVILAAMSPVFEAMLKEGTREHQDSKVNIEDIKSDVFEVFLRFLYSGQVEQLDEMFMDLLAAADKYDVQPLKEICVRHMAENISVDNAIELLILAERHSVESLKSLSLQFIKMNFTDVVKTACWSFFLENQPHGAKRMRDGCLKSENISLAAKK